MAKGLKTIVTLIVGASVIAGVAIFFLFSSLDSIIQSAVETYGSQATGTKVRLDKVQISATSGEGAFKGLSVANPAGYQTPYAFELGEVALALDTASLTLDVVVIRKIVIDSPNVVYELRNGGSNIDAIRKNVDAYTSALGMGKGSSVGSSSKASEEGPKLIIENVYFKNGTVEVSASFLGGKTLSTPLPDLHLTDIGKEEGGATPGQVVEEILAAVNKGTTDAVGSLNLSAMADSLGQGAAKVGQTLMKGSGEAGETISKGAQGAGEAIKGLFGN